ncbi:MAG: transposase [Nitrospinota bacterium]
MDEKYALTWTRLSCHNLVCKKVRLLLFVLAYSLGNFLRSLALPMGLRHWSLRSLQVKLIKMGGRIVRHARRIIFKLPEALASGECFAVILDRINRLRAVRVDRVKPSPTEGERADLVSPCVDLSEGVAQGGDAMVFPSGDTTQLSVHSAQNDVDSRGRAGSNAVQGHRWAAVACSQFEIANFG